MTTVCLPSHVQHQTRERGHFKSWGVVWSCVWRSCEDDSCDGSRSYLMIYCNCLSGFVFRSLLSSSLWLPSCRIFFFPPLRFVTTMKEPSNAPICLRERFNQEAFAALKAVMSSPPERCTPQMFGIIFKINLGGGGTPKDVGSTHATSWSEWRVKCTTLESNFLIWALSQ